MKRFNNLLLIALGAVLLFSCSKEPFMGGGESLPEGTVGIQILLPASADTEVQGAESDGAQTSHASRALPPTPGTASENRITNLKFFIAHSAADGKEVIKRIVEVKDPAIGLPNDPDADAQWDYKTKVLAIRNMKNPEEPHKVFVVANWADAPTTLIEGAPLETLTRAITHLTAAIPTPDDKHPMVMSGFTVNHNFATTPLVKVPIEHQAARFKFTVGISKSFNDMYYDELVFGDPKKKHILAEVGNTYNSSYVFRQAPPAMPADAAELPITLQIARSTPSPDFPISNLWVSSEYTYLYENPVVGITEYSKAHATYFLINIPYYRTSDQARELINNYYKVKIYDYDNTNPNRYTTLRNTYYDVIVSIAGFGSEDPMKPVEIAAAVTVRPWTAVDVNGDITDQKPIDSKLEILTADPKVVYVGGVRNAALSRIDFWTDRPAAEVRLDPIVKTGENFDTDINLTDYFEGTTDLHLTPNTDGKGGFDGYIDLNYIDGKVLPGVNMMKMKIKLTAGGITKELTVRFSHIIDHLVVGSVVVTLRDYHQWTGTVADGGNGVYQMPTPQSPELDRPYARFEMASADATKDPVDWTTARTSCPSGWRLPRSMEVFAFTQYPYSPYFMPVRGKTYWSASETSPDRAYAVEFRSKDSYLNHYKKTDKHSVRCVRSEELPNKVFIEYVPWDPMYCLDFPNPTICDAGAQIGNLFNQHPVYGFDAWYTANGQRYQAGDIVPKHVKNLLLFCGWAKPFRLGNLELSYKSFTGLSWGEARGLGKGANDKLVNDPYKLGILYTGCNGQFREDQGWRLPTLEELALISNNFFLLRMNGVEIYKEPYWSANESTVPNWALSFNLLNNTTTEIQKYHGIRSMCVRTVK